MDALTISIEELNKAYDEACQWSISSFPVLVAPDLTEDNVITINLIDTMELIGHRGTASTYPKADLPKYWLPKEYNLNTREFRGKVLAPVFERTAKDQGFNLISNGWDHQRQCIKFICKRGTYQRVYKQDPNADLSVHLNKAATKRKPTTSRPIQGKHPRCNFHFDVFWHEGKQRWYLPKKQSGCKNHCGHLWTPPELVGLPLKSLPDEEIRLAGEGMSEYMKNSLVQALLFRRNQTIISRDRLCYFKDHLNMCGDNYLLKTIPDATDSSGPPPSTPADRLLHALAKDPYVSYVALYGKFESNLLTIRQKAQSDRIDEDSEINASDHQGANSSARSCDRLFFLLAVHFWCTHPLLRP